MVNFLWVIHDNSVNTIIVKTNLIAETDYFIS